MMEKLRRYVQQAQIKDESQKSVPQLFEAGNISDELALGNVEMDELGEKLRREITERERVGTNLGDNLHAIVS